MGIQKSLDIVHFQEQHSQRVLCRRAFLNLIQSFINILYNIWLLLVSTKSTVLSPKGIDFFFISVRSFVLFSKDRYLVG